MLISLYTGYAIRMFLFSTGSRLQKHGHANPKKNVVAEHENKADSVGDSDYVNPYNCPLCLQRL